MSPQRSVGILGIEAYLPKNVRGNDAWDSKVVNQWLSRMGNIVPRSESAAEKVTDGVRKSIQALSKLTDDPFQGSVQRHVMADDERSSDMEAAAAGEVLKTCGVSPSDVQVLITHSMLPDYLCVNQASIVHNKLGLPVDTLAFAIDGVCTSFILQLNAANQWIRAQSASRILVTQSSGCTRLMPMDQPYSAWFGDAAAAALLGPVDEGYGLLDVGFRTYGDMCKAFCATVPGEQWWSGGKIVATNEDKVAARRMQLMAADIGAEVIDEMLNRAGVKKEEVRFFASHQPAAWFRDVLKDHSGLTNATTVNTFPWTANVSSVNVPIQLAVAKKEGLLKRGDVVVMFTLASGMMAAGAVLRWA